MHSVCGSFGTHPLNRFSGKKLAHEIMRDTPPERDMWVGGGPTVDREAEKDRLSKVVSGGAEGNDGPSVWRACSVHFGQGG